MILTKKFPMEMKLTSKIILNEQLIISLINKHIFIFIFKLNILKLNYNHQSPKSILEPNILDSFIF